MAFGVPVVAKVDVKGRELGFIGFFKYIIILDIKFFGRGIH
jgi:hypothetical protein